MSDEMREERSRQTTDGKSEWKYDRRNRKGRRRLHDMGDLGTDGRIVRKGLKM
jgi:hypothetical protein